MKLQLTEHEIYTLKQLVNQNDKIETIKYIRELTGLGLKESKELSDDFFRSPAIIDNLLVKTTEEEIIEGYIHEHDSKSHELNEDEFNFVKMLLQKGQKLQAIKYVKERLATGLKEAKEFVDSLEANNSTTETYVFEQDDNVISEIDIDEEVTATFEPAVKTKKISPPKKKSAKKKRTTSYESEPIIFGKSIDRDKNKGKRRRQSNSGCMLMLTFMFVTGLLIIGGILFA